MDRILLFMENRENRRLLAGLLSREYEVILAEEKEELSSPFDLGILDGLSLDRFWNQVQARRDSEQPVYLPFLLLTSRPDVGMITRHLWRTVDELILMPIIPIELRARVEILLRARRLSQEVERRYYALAENSPSGIFIAQDDLLVYANPIFRETVGRSSGEVTELCFVDLVHPDDREMVRAYLNDLKAGKAAPRCCEIRLVIPGGYGPRWVDLWGASIPFRGKPAFLGITLDITERKQTEEELERYRGHLEEMVRERTGQLTRANEQLRQEIAERGRAEEAAESASTQLNQIFDASGDGMCVLDRELRVIRFNRTLGFMLGLSSEEAVGKRCSDVLSSILCGSPDCPVPRILAGEQRIECDTELTGRDGRKIPCILTATPLRQSDGRLIGIVINFKDITERKRIAEELQRAQRLESLGILAGGIAHDFNNILTVLSGSLFLAKRHIMPGTEDFKLLTRVGDASLNQAKRLTHQLLTFARGGAPIRKTTFVPGLLRDAVNFSLSGSRIRSEFVLPEDLWLAEIDEDQISQAIHNIIINAAQAMPRGGVIRIQAENVTVGPEAGLPLQAGRYVKVSIIDQGPGIPAEILPKIFDPYFTTKPGGSGLGLAVVYSVMKRHQGHVSAESRPGAGTTFSLYLPVPEEKPAVEEQIREEISRKAREEIRKKRLQPGQGRILLMDDEQSMRDVAGNILSFLGYEVEFAIEGEEAVRLYRKALESGQPFDCVILDLTIAGGMGGDEAIRILREIDPGVKAIVSSGYSNAPIMSEYKKYGFKEVVAKPYGAEELSEKLHRVMGDEGR
ncbi:MAG: PAS domain S-box protein [bacterium]